MAQTVILVGMPGSGKSTAGVLLAKALGLPFVDTDLLIQVRAGRRLQEIIDGEGLEAFLAMEERVLLEADLDGVVATGGSVVYSAAVVERLRSLGEVIYLRVEICELTRRLGNIDTRGIAMPPGLTLADLCAQREPLYQAAAHWILEQDRRQDIEETVRALARHVSGE